jgi:hypothetical protein
MNTTSDSLFPHVLVRLGGSSYNALEALKQSDLEETLSGLIRFEQKRTRQKETLCEELLEFIRTLDDTQAQNQVQNVRRDLYNGRKIKAGKLKKALQWMPEELQNAVQRYLKGAEKGKQLRQQAYQQYEQQLPQMRTQLQTFSQEEALRKGLVLSSQGFLKKLPSYRKASPGSLAKKQLRTEQSLLKYLTRIKAKNSPFSTFNNLSLGTIVPTAAPIQVSSDSQSKVVGHTRLNNQLFRYLKGLITSYPAIYRHLLLRANPTITNAEEQYLYLTNHHNIEAFQRLPQQPIVKLVLELCKAEPAGITFQDLVNEITDYVEADIEAIEQYVRKLTDFGFLEFDFTVSGIDPNWDEQLVRVLKGLREKDVPLTDDLIQTLKNIRAWAELYSEADVDERQQLLTQSYDAFRAVCMRLHEAAGLPEEERLTYEERLARYRQMQQEQKNDGSEAVAVELPPAPPEKVAFQHHNATFFYFKPEQMFYEDTTRQVAITLGNQPLQQWVAKVEKLLQALPLFRGHDSERATMKHYFLEHYASDAVVPLLQFYEHYYRDVKKVEAEQKAKKQSATSADSADTNDSASSEKASETFSIPELEKKRNQVQQWNQALAEQLKTRGSISSDLVNITYEDIEGVNTSLELEPSSAGSNSYGGFVQFYQEEDAEQGLVLKGVINALFPGYGRMMSRFLHILPYQVTEDIRDWNQQLQDKNSLLIEDCDASYFNANLHPPLLPQEVRMPGGHNSLPASQQIPITDFVVRYNAEEENLQLVHQPSDKRAYVMDLGFQGSQGRSPLFQLLEKFTKAEYRYTNPIQQVVNQLSSPATEEGSTIRVYPRINYEDQITLQRKTWVVPYDHIPRREPQESDAAYYYRINLWRKEQQMPEDIFITLNPNRGGDTTSEQKKTKLSRDDYKPQYISFANPLLVGLLEKLLLKEPTAVVITEMLPSGDDMLTIDQQKYVSEYVVQWYT